MASILTSPRPIKKPPKPDLVLGIEGGATRTVALLVDGADRLVRRVESGPGNVRLLSDPQLARLFRGLAKDVPRPQAVAIGMAGARTETDQERIRVAAARVWPQIPCLATHDLETALAAADEKTAASAAARVLILCGTGSCCYGRTPTGKSVKVGGWGHVLGDRGSAYAIGLRALREVICFFDHHGSWSPLGRRLLHKMAIQDPEVLVGWSQQAVKADIAELAVTVFTSGKQGDHPARAILRAAALELARDALACARRLIPKKQSVCFVLAGGVLLKQPQFAAWVSRSLREHWPKAVITSLKRESAWGAIVLARENL